MVFETGLPITTDEIHKNYLRLAYKFAGLHSEDIKTKTGAVIVTPDLRTILAYGWNHFPPGFNPTEEELEDIEFKKDIIHAEPAAIHYAAREGIKIDGAVMYMPWTPCRPCAFDIADAGIKLLIGHKQMVDKTYEKWHESCRKAIDDLNRCGVEQILYDGKIGEVKALFDKQIWEP